MIGRVSLGLLISTVLLAQDGRQVFARDCAVCHGDGRGTERGPNLANNRRVRTQSRDELKAVIRNGVPAAGMPAFPPPPAELDAVTDSVRSVSDRAAGERFFFQDGDCANCHMVFGQGAAVGPDLSAVGHEMTLDEIDVNATPFAGAILLEAMEDLKGSSLARVCGDISC